MTINFLNKNIHVPKNTFIASAGVFSSVIYQLVAEKENIIGFIDQNSDLHKKNYAITNRQIYSYEYLKQFDETANIIVSHPRKNDIINCIRKVNDKINIIIY